MGSLEEKGNRTSYSTSINSKDNASVIQINNDGTATFNFYPVPTDTRDEEGKKENDRMLFSRYYEKLTFDKMREFVYRLLNEPVWSIDLNDKVILFLEFATYDSPERFFFDEKMQNKRIELKNICYEFYGYFIEYGAPGDDCNVCSLRSYDHNQEELERIRKIMIPPAEKMLEAYREFVLYARKEMLFL